MKTLRNAFIYLISTFLEKGLVFLLIPVYTHYLSTYDYGILSLIQAFVSVLVVLFSLSLVGAGSRYHLDGDENYRKLHYGNIFAATFLISMINITFLFFIKDYLFKLMGNIPVYPYFYLAVGIAFLTTIFAIYQLKLQMEQRAFLYSINSFLKTLLGALFSMFFVVFLHQKAEGALLGQLLGLFIIILYITNFFLRKEIKLNLDANLLKRNLKYSIFLVPHNLSGIANQLLDKFFIANMINVSQAGIYTLGGQIVSILGIINVILNRTLTPRILEAFKKKDYEFLKNLSLIVISFMAILASFLILFSKEIIQLIAPDSYQRAYLVINILSFYFVYQMYYFMVVSVLFYVERATKLMPLITFSSFLLNVIFNYILVKNFNIVGAALATTLSIVIITYLVLFIADRYIKVGYNHLKIHFIIFSLLSMVFFPFNIDILLIKILVYILFVVAIFIIEKQNPLISPIWRKLLERYF